MRKGLFLKNIWQIMILYKRRTLLSMLGVLFGILALVAVGHISTAMKRQIKDTLEKFGPNLIIVRAGEMRVTGRGTYQFSTAQTLKLEDVKAIEIAINGVIKAVPLAEVMFPLRYKGTVTQAKLIGTTNKIKELRNLILQEGRFFNKKEEKIGQRKAVIGYKVWKTLLGKKVSFGETILIWRVPCEVIGVLAEKGTDLTGEDLDSVVYLPLKTVMKRFLNVDYLSAILIKMKEDVNIAKVKEEIKKLLRKRHKIGPSEPDDFTVYALEDLTKTKKKGLALVSLLSKMAATISFIIGGLGIFALMLLSVAERYYEIGIRRAVGAKKRDILLQFLGEAIFISFCGGIGGIVLGISVAWIVELIVHLPFVLSPIRFIFALSISLGLGFIAGVYPAYLAASMPPLRALLK
ncbi:MAG TPA: FtsX-like permease family protein [Candidatus Desulfofervidus auxilii]|uniref:FtsX-like permease family protein n=1 Tax=Desulfofervidus auxilii TaxID=1621989 RepID=A0A7V0IA71_DESA2|nr:FtsX-like permease family protein [Candidatus Desulfofervidus auxilii]